MAPQVPTVTIDDLRVFHANHFPHDVRSEQCVDGPEATVAHSDESVVECIKDDGLGYYPDGTKRTLTDEQIAMFRHSEIQEILRKRRSQRESGEVLEDASSATGPSSSRATPTTSTPGQPCITSGADLNKTQSGRIEKPKTQQWATSSARTKKRNKQNRNNYKAKKKAEGYERRKAEHNKDKGNESDEWDPWHQANGPDVQNEQSFDLDY